MRTRLVDSYTDPATSIVYGLRGDPTDFSLSQQYTHEHVKAVASVFLSAGMAAVEVSGFDYTLAGGLSLSIAAGQAFDAAANYYETISDPEGQPTVVTLDAADATNPRIDVIYALLEQGVEAEPLPRTFRRLLTPTEIAAGTPEYNPTNITVFAELQTRATVRVLKGTPSPAPVAPVVGANEVALFQVRVNANAATLVAGNVTDVRNAARSLAQAWAQIDANTAALGGGMFESIQDMIATFLGVTPNTGLSITYNDAANTLTLAGVAASGAAMGMMSAADYNTLHAATPSATANAISQRDSNGDVSARDYKPTRQILFPDSSVLTQPRFKEQQIIIFDLETAFTTQATPYPGNSVYVTSPSGVAFYVNLNLADFANIPLVFECIGKHADGGLTTTEADLWNVTDNVSVANVKWLHGAGVSIARSAPFTLSGSTRKRFQVKLGIQQQQGSDTAFIWTARLIAYPAYDTCGGWGQSACPL
jgi:hypothetical protein